jgi:hypothetical protein
MKRMLGLLLILLLALTIMPVGAQDSNNTGTPVEFSGTVESITGTTIVVSGLTVDISTLDSSVVAVLQNGMQITINGNLDGTTVIAITVVLPDGVTPSATPEATQEVGDDDGITIQIFISTDGGTTWVSSDSDDVEADDNEEVLVRFVVLNLSGGVLTGIDLTGTNFDISLCEIPTELADGDDFDCIVTMVYVADGDDEGLDLVVVITGNLNGVVIVISRDVVIDEDDDDDDEDGIVIVIEGPVTAIVGNQITIFNFNIIVGENDPMLTVIQIGDVLRIEGDWDDDSPIIIAIIIIFVDIDVFVFDGQVWRDQGNCNNAPPPWAPANGWRRRCETPRGGGSGGGSGGGRGRGRGRSGSS